MIDDKQQDKLVMEQPHVWFTREEAAQYVRLSTSRLAHMASEKIGPRFFKNGKMVRYRREDLDAWVMGEEVRPETEAESDWRIMEAIASETRREFFGD